MNRIKILVVEDNWHMRALTKSLLSAFGIKHVDCVDNTETALEIFAQEKHDIILVDWLIEPYNGIDFTQKIRENPETPNPYVPVILMTGYSEKTRVIEARDAGITEFLVKPFTSHSLYSRIEHIIEKPRQFVKAPGYFGPDRRRMKDVPYSGPERRRAMLAKRASGSNPGGRRRGRLADKVREKQQNKEQ